MDFKSFMTKLLPTFGKRLVLTELEQIKDKLNSYTIPAYKTAQGVHDKLESAEAKFFEGVYHKMIGRGKMFQEISKRLEVASEVCDYLLDAVNDKFQEDITRASLSAYTLNVLKLTEAISFISDYGRRLVVFVTTVELNKKMGVEELDGITKAEKDFIYEYRNAFFEGLKILETSADDIEKKLEAIPNVLVNPDNFDTVKSAVGVGNADPLKLNFFSPRYNPFLFVNMKIVTYQASKYNQAKADLKEIQIKILKLKQLREGKEDAKLDTQIEYYTNLNNHLKADIDRMEEEYELR